MNIRLDKYLADMGIGTRSEVKAEIKKGKIKINGNEYILQNDLGNGRVETAALP